MNTEALIERTEGPLGGVSRALRSRLGNTLLATNLVVVSWTTLAEWSQRASEYGHLSALDEGYGTHQSAWAALLFAGYMVLTGPAWLAAGLVQGLLWPPLAALGLAAPHGLARALFVLFGSAQWLLVGHCVEQRRRQPRPPVSVVPDVPRPPGAVAARPPRPIGVF